MLVLSRLRDEIIDIGKAGDVLTGPIKLQVGEIRGDKVRLGIECQKDIAVHRREVTDAIARQEAALRK